MRVETPSVLLIYTGGTIGMIENPETGALENFNFDHLLLGYGTSLLGKTCKDHQL